MNDQAAPEPEPHVTTVHDPAAPGGGLRLCAGDCVVAHVEYAEFSCT